MSSARPRVLMSFFDEKYGVCSTFTEVVEEHFSIVWFEEFEKDRTKYSDIVAYLCWGKTPMSKEWLDALPKLKIVAAVGAGYNHLDVPLIRSYGVKVSNTPDVLSAATADMGMTLLLAAARDLIRFVEVCKSPTLKRFAVNDMATDLNGATLGIVGMGRIGYFVAKRAYAFDMKIVYHNRNRRPEQEETAVGATYYAKLNEMLPHCDFVIVVVCMTEETKHIIGPEQFKAMKKTATLINISRGGTVDQEALVHALKSGEIRGAALDVTTPEPLPRDHELLKMPNVIISPHMGSQTRGTRVKMIQLAVENTLAAIEGRPLPTEVFE